MGEEEKNRYILARSLNSEHHKNVAILYMIVDGNAISEAFEQLKTEDTERYLTTADGTILYSSEAGKLNEKLDISSLDVKKIQDSRRVRLNEREYLMTARHMMSVDWYCISLISIDQLRKTVLRMLRRYIFTPLRMLKTERDKYAQGEIGVANMQRIGVGEFQSLSNHFNHVTVNGVNSNVCYCSGVCISHCKK